MMNTRPIILFENVDMIFGSRPLKVLPLLDQGTSHGEIYEQTGHVVAARGITLEIFKGEIFVLMGLSGSGKSTLLRCVNGLNRPTRGKVLIDHQDKYVDLKSCPANLLRQIRVSRISMVFQQFALMPWRTVGDNIAYALELQGLPKKQHQHKIMSYLELVHLNEWVNKFPHELSGGMQQRVGLARALATEGDILLMDEPFSALDPLIRNELQDELLELQKKLQKTILFVCHDFDEAIKLGSRIGIMKNGHLLKVGTAQEMIHSENLISVKIPNRPVVLTNDQGKFIGVVGGHEIFKHILDTSSANQG